MILSAFDDYFLDILLHLELQNGDFCNPIIPHASSNEFFYEKEFSTINYLLMQES